MDFISYRGLPMRVIQSLSWGKEPLLDQAGHTTYECSRYHGSLLVAYNPGAVSFPPGTNPAALPVPAPTPPNQIELPPAGQGQLPAQTEVAIRNYLEQPRGQLIAMSAGNIWLKSPSDRTIASNSLGDVRNGPFLKVNTIQYSQGERLWKIHLNFETYVNENPSGVSPENPFPPLILSNRWYATDDTNWQHLRTRIYQGTCTVRGDVLGTNVPPQNMIDGFRDSFAAFSVPLGMQRVKVHVTVTPDGNTAHYTVIDEEQLFNQNFDSPAIRIETVDTTWMWTGSVRRAIAGIGGASRVINDLGPRSMQFGPFAIFAQLRNLGGIISDASNQTRANLPKMYKNLVVRCWGNQLTPRTELVAYAIRVAVTRMGTTNLIDATTSEVSVSQDTNKFCQVSYTISWGQDIAANFIGGNIGTLYIATAELFGAGIGNLNGAGAFTNSIMTDPDTRNINGLNVLQSQRLINPPFPADSQTRGTASLPTLQVLLTQTLEGFNASPAAVP
jgi:hypothetical protein